MYPHTSLSSMRASSKTSHRVSRCFCSSPQLSGQQTASFPQWLLRTMVFFHVDATPRVVLCEGAASNRRVTPMGHAFGIDSSVGCWMILSILVVTTSIVAPDDDFHQQFIKINIRQKI